MAETTDGGNGGFDVALHYIDNAILEGTLANGDRLPNERALAADIGVSRGAVREAIRVLQTQGILTSSTGPGNGTRVQTAPVSALQRMLRMHLALGTVDFSDLTETRVALERAACAAAAQQRNPDALARAELTLVAMTSVTAITEFNELDTRFHAAIVDAGDNKLIRHLTIAIREAAAFPIHMAEHSIEEWQPLREQLISQHRQIFVAVSSGDSALAMALAETHIRHAYGVLTTVD